MMNSNTKAKSTSQGTAKRLASALFGAVAAMAATGAHALELDKKPVYSVEDIKSLIAERYEVKPPKIVQIDEDDDLIVDYKIQVDHIDKKTNVNTPAIDHSATALRTFLVSIEPDKWEFEDLELPVEKSDCESDDKKIRTYCHNRLLGKYIVELSNREDVDNEEFADNLFSLGMLPDGKDGLIRWGDLSEGVEGFKKDEGLYATMDPKTYKIRMDFFGKKMGEKDGSKLFDQ